MASVFDTIKMKAGDTDRSNNWYRGQVSRIASGTTARELFRQGKLARRPSVGRLNLFGYNPKLRRTLPLYFCGLLGLNTPLYARLSMLGNLLNFIVVWVARRLPV